MRGRESIKLAVILRENSSRARPSRKANVNVAIQPATRGHFLLLRGEGGRALISDRSLKETRAELLQDRWDRKKTVNKTPRLHLIECKGN